MCLGSLITYWVYDIQAWVIYFYLGTQLVLFSLFIGLAQTARLTAQICYGFLNAIVITIAVLHADNHANFGPLLRESLHAIFQTTPSETIGYLKSFTSSQAIPVLLTILVLFLGSLAAFRRAPPPQVTGIATVIVAAILLYSGRVLPVQLWVTATDYVETMNRFRESRQGLLQEAGELTFDREQTVVLVMGESTTRHHLGLYGYPRNTTPLLSNLESELAIYNDIISSHSHTNPSLSRALTFNQRGEYGPFHTRLDLLNALNQAGISTHWFSNQNTIGIYDNQVAAITSQASEVLYHDGTMGWDGWARTDVFDEVLLGPLRQAISANQSRLIVLHMMNSHFPYCEMVPAEFESPQFDNEEIESAFYGNYLNDTSPSVRHQLLEFRRCYDRAVSYSDYIAHQAIETARQSGEAVTVIFTADHGEAPLIGTGHNSQRHSHFHVEIPFVIWQTEGNRSIQPGRYPVKGSLEDLSYVIADLFDLEGIEEHQRRSFVNPSFEYTPRLTLNGRVSYEQPPFDDGDHIEAVRANVSLLTDEQRSKVWAHRINSAGKMLEARELFRGIETDVVFDDGVFQITHPPAPPVGLTLEDLLQQDYDGLGYWLDWKNANAANVAQAKQRLDQLDQRHNLKSRSIVEFENTGQLAPALVEEGWKVSYYLPTERLLACQQSCNSEERELLANEIWQQYIANNFTAVSFDVRLTPFVEQHLLERIRTNGASVYVWAPSVNFSEESAQYPINMVLQKDWIDIILVSFASHFAN